MKNRLLSSLPAALERQEFHLRFQPQVDFTGRLVGNEVLLAWLHPELGQVPTEEFIPIAEKTGIISDIGQWVLREACRYTEQWRREIGVDVRTAVNISAVELAEPGFVESVITALNNTGLPPQFLELEITERLLLRDMDQAGESLRQLRRAGVRSAIDDFGTGYSSLSYLRDLPLDGLKIDRVFLTGLENNPRYVNLLGAIVALGHALGLEVTAEGVETREQCFLARSAGCNLAQGHLFGAPLDAPGMAELLSRAQPVFAELIANA